MLPMTACQTEASIHVKNLKKGMIDSLSSFNKEDFILENDLINATYVERHLLRAHLISLRIQTGDRLYL